MVFDCAAYYRHRCLLYIKEKTILNRRNQMIKTKIFLAGGLLPTLLFLGMFVCAACAEEDSNTDNMVIAEEQNKSLLAFLAKLAAKTPLLIKTN